MLFKLVRPASLALLTAAFTLSTVAPTFALDLNPEQRARFSEFLKQQEKNIADQEAKINQFESSLSRAKLLNGVYYVELAPGLALTTVGGTMLYDGYKATERAQKLAAEKSAAAAAAEQGAKATAKGPLKLKLISYFDAIKRRANSFVTGNNTNLEEFLTQVEQLRKEGKPLPISKLDLARFKVANRYFKLNAKSKIVVGSIVATVGLAMLTHSGVEAIVLSPERIEELKLEIEKAKYDLEIMKMTQKRYQEITNTESEPTGEAASEPAVQQ